MSSIIDFDYFIVSCYIKDWLSCVNPKSPASHPSLKWSKLRERERESPVFHPMFSFKDTHVCPVLVEKAIQHFQKLLSLLAQHKYVKSPTGVQASSPPISGRSSPSLPPMLLADIVQTLSPTCSYTIKTAFVLTDFSLCLLHPRKI